MKSVALVGLLLACLIGNPRIFQFDIAEAAFLSTVKPCMGRVLNYDFAHDAGVFVGDFGPAAWKRVVTKTSKGWPSSKERLPIAVVFVGSRIYFLDPFPKSFSAYYESIVVGCLAAGKQGFPKVICGHEEGRPSNICLCVTYFCRSVKCIRFQFKIESDICGRRFANIRNNNPSLYRYRIAVEHQGAKEFYLGFYPSSVSFRDGSFCDFDLLSGSFSSVGRRFSGIGTMLHPIAYQSELPIEQPNLERSSDEQKPSSVGKNPRRYSEPPFIRRFFVAFLFIPLGFGCALWGGNCAYNKRIGLGAAFALLGGALFCVGGGIIALSFWPVTWNWWI